MTAVATTAPEIKVDGASLPDNWQSSMTGLRVELGLCLIGRATLRFADAGYQLSASNKFSLGSKVDIGVQGGSMLLSGLVTGVSLEQTSSDTPELLVTVDDHGCTLALGTRVKTYLQSSYADVLRQIAGELNLQLKDSASSIGAVHDYLLQSGSDLAFLQTIAERTGTVWWLDGTTLTISDADAVTGSVALALMETLSEFSVRASALRPTAVAVKGWDANAQQDVSGQSTAPVDRASSAFVSDYLGDKPSTLRSSTQSSFDLNPEDTSEAGNIATALYNDITSSAIVARGTTLINPAIKLMTRVEVTGAGPASGSYTVSEVEHIYRWDGFYTRFVAGPIRPGGLVDTLGPSTPDPGFEIGGLLTATVSNLDDPDNVGRVKVTYAASGGTVDSAWARVVGLGVGKGRGSVFQPEVNDEVLVGFERGDSRRPVVLGGLYSQKNTLPTGTAAVKDNVVGYRRIMSRLGHVIEMGDGDGPAQQHLLLQLAGGEHKLRLGADRFDLELAQGKPISIKAGGATFAIDEQGNVSIEGNKVTIKAQSQVSVEGTAGVELKSDAKVALQAAMIDVKANASATVDGGGTLGLKGGMVAIN